MSFFSSILEKLGIGTHSNDTAQAAPVSPGTARLRYASTFPGDSNTFTTSSITALLISCK